MLLRVSLLFHRGLCLFMALPQRLIRTFLALQLFLLARQLHLKTLDLVLEVGHMCFLVFVWVVRCLAKLLMLLTLVVTSVAVLCLLGSFCRGLNRRSRRGKILSRGILLYIDRDLVD